MRRNAWVDNALGPTSLCASTRMSNAYFVGARVDIHEFASTRMSSANFVGARVARHELVSLAM